MPGKAQVDRGRRRDSLRSAWIAAKDVLGALDLAGADRGLSLPELERLEVPPRQPLARIGADDLSFELSGVALDEVVAMHQARDQSERRQ